MGYNEPLITYERNIMEPNKFKKFVKKNLPIIVAGIAGAVVGTLITYNKVSLFVPKEALIGEGHWGAVINDTTKRVTGFVKI